jgi:hypothetical protein
MAAIAFAERINRSQIENLTLQDASNSFAAHSFPTLKGVARVDIRQCAFAPTAIQQILDYAFEASFEATIKEIVLSGSQFGFKTVCPDSL